MEETISLNEIKKYLYITKFNATLNRVCEAVMYYRFNYKEIIFEFPISTVTHVDCLEYNLSADLGTTNFYPEMKASELIRWIGKALDNGELIKVHEEKF